MEKTKETIREVGLGWKGRQNNIRAGDDKRGV